MTMRNIAIFILLILVSLNCFGQKIKITGTVTDRHTSEPIIGATVKITDTTTEVYTDIDGKYEIEAHSNSLLFFSSLGYRSKEIATLNNFVIDVQLEENNGDFGLPSTYDIRSYVSIGGQATYTHSTFGYAANISTTLPFTTNARYGTSLYNKIKSKSSIGVKFNKAYPQDKYLQSSLYFEHNPLSRTPISIGRIADLSLYLRIGLYIHSKGSEIQSQNFEYGGGVYMSIPYLRIFKFVVGYQGYNRKHEYNNLYFGLRYTLPLTSIAYY